MSTEYLARVAQVRSLQGGRHSTESVYYRHLVRHCSRYVTAGIAATGITPNQVTGSMLLWGLVGSILLALGSAGSFMAGSICFMILHLTDCVDGELAKYRAATSRGGDYLDRVIHYATNTACVLGYTIGLFRAWESLSWLVVGCTVTVVYVTDEAARDLLVTCGVVAQGIGADRKMLKRSTSIGRPSILRSLVFATGSMMGLWYTTAALTLAVTLTTANATWAPTVVFSWFSAVTLIRALLRVRTIANALANA